jgi:hypothetical protein
LSPTVEAASSWLAQAAQQISPKRTSMPARWVRGVEVAVGNPPKILGSLSCLRSGRVAAVTPAAGSAGCSQLVRQRLGSLVCIGSVGVHAICGAHRLFLSSLCCGVLRCAVMCLCCAAGLCQRSQLVPAASWGVPVAAN